MRILHYSLGFPPYSRGGLTKYAVDLLLEEQRQQHQVAMLWPGKISEYGNPTIKKRKEYQGIESYELENPIYLPQIYGIREIESFVIDGKEESYTEFLEQWKPDVIHLHTLMGIHIQFLETAKKLKIKMVYTSHDFFGLCPKTIMYFNQKSCKDNLECKGCDLCCQYALSPKKMKVLQSKAYRVLKNSRLVSLIRKAGKKKMFSVEEAYEEKELHNNPQYVQLRKRYMEYFSLIDVIHFNSSYMKEVFSKYMNVEKGIVCNISHSDIDNHMSLYHKKITDDVLKITYMGPLAAYKGFNMLKDVLDEIYQEGRRDFELTIYHPLDEHREYIHACEPYKYENLDKVLGNADIVAVPHDVSYGFVALEAISHGVPVLVSDEVGAKDLIENDITGFVFSYEHKELKNKILELLSNKDKVEQVKKNIKEQITIKNMESHTKEIVEKIYGA
ncbi:MAG: glycosyltransferase [Eubacterium sp.]|nr:glycosyltransferase [Eubacterium sp.]